MEIVKVTNDNFEQEVLACKEPVLLDFWADWCGPCKMQAPILDALAEEMDGKIKVGKVNVDEEAALALKYQVMSIPTMVLMDQGVFVKRVSGVQQLEDLRAFVGK
ncbi:MAG: thioredoxin [Eubacterium sp.]|nr:thioredoxin [Eubacterium sp.]